MNSKQFSVSLGLVLLLAVLVLAGSQPRPVLSAELAEEPEYWINAGALGELCPKQTVDFWVSVGEIRRTGAYGIDFRGIPGIRVGVKPSRGSISPATTNTDILGIAKFKYTAPDKPVKDEFTATADGVDTARGKVVGLSFKDAVSVPQCDYKIKIDGKTTTQPYAKFSLDGTGKAKVQDDGKMQGEGTLTLAGEAIEPLFTQFCKETWGTTHSFTIGGDVIGESAAFKLTFKPAEKPAKAKCEVRGQTIERDIPYGAVDPNTFGLNEFTVPALKGGSVPFPVPPPATGYMNVIVQVVRDYSKAR